MIKSHVSFHLSCKTHAHTDKVPEECVCRWAQHLPLWLRGIMRRYGWQCVFYCPLSRPPSRLPRDLTVSFGWQSALLNPQCSGINADDTLTFEGCVSVRLKCLPSPGSRWAMHTCGWDWIRCQVRPPSADCVVQKSTKADCVVQKSTKQSGEFMQIIKWCQTHRFIAIKLWIFIVYHN